jgi:hypothetical protein
MTMNAQERLAYLLEVVETPNMRGWMAGELPQALGSLEDANTLLGVIEQSSPLTRSAFIAISLPTGLQLWDKGPLLDALPLPVGLREKVKALGVTRTPRWQIDGYQSEPTLADAMRDVLRDKIKAKTTAIVGWLDALDTSGMSVAEVEAYAADLLASDDGNPSTGGE